MNRIKKISMASENNVIKFAVTELEKYLKIMSAADGMTTNIDVGNCCCESMNDGIRVGLLSDFGLQSKFEIDDPALDDLIYIDIENSSGIIAGNNPRSVLLAVYRFLAETGCRWVRPGVEGEFIPRSSDMCFTVRLQEKPAYRHRGICIEGAASYENVADMIDWLPKVGFNSYFIQFREAYTFFERWYNHRHNPLKSPEPFSVDQAREFVRKAEMEISKRGLVYHAVGHGWTCEPLGIPGLSWTAYEYEFPEDKRYLLAEINGKREIFDGSPLNTNLCYSNPEVRELITKDIVNYLKGHGNIDILHFWLADSINNQCECENCRKAIPSEFYVQMLNELDELLSRNHINTKIVFLIYLDLLWAPEVNRIKNRERFILMFAPITRTYSSPFSPEEGIKETSRYQRNQLVFPGSIEENIAFLHQWQCNFSGDSFNFDYYFMWDHFYDPGYFKTAKVIHEDIKSLKNIGLNGLISCQSQRVFLPTGLGMFTMAKTLWNPDLGFDEIMTEYYLSAFGADGEKCSRYFAEVSELFDPPYCRGERDLADEKAAGRFKSIKGFMDDFDAIIDRNSNNGNDCYKRSWQYLKLHKEISVRFAKVLEHRALNDQENTLKFWEELKTYVQTIEDQVQPIFDVFEFIETFEVMNKRILVF